MGQPLFNRLSASSASLRTEMSKNAQVPGTVECGLPPYVSAAPGAGKTRPAFVRRVGCSGGASAARRDRLPYAPLTRSGRRPPGRLACIRAGRRRLRPPADFHGVAVTYARAAASARAGRRSARRGTLVIADEAHHLGDELAWGRASRRPSRNRRAGCCSRARRFAPTTTPIPGVHYDAMGFAVPDVSYSYADAVRDGICRPVTFIPYDGTLTGSCGRRHDRGLVRRRA